MGEFAKWAEQLPAGDRQPIPDWRERASEQVEQFRKIMPTSAEEGAQNASETLSKLYKMLHGLGYNFRMQRHLDSPKETTQLLPEGDPGIPGKDMTISLPKMAEWLEPRLLSKEAIGPMRAWMQNKEVETKAKLRDKKRRAFAHTTDPMTQPLFAPAAAITIPEAFRKGFTQADADAAVARREVLSVELAKAKEEFEQALTEEYRGRKAASAGEMVDGLAVGMLELEKQGLEEEQGLGMKALNTYLAMAALLGYGTHRAAESFVSKREPGRQKQKLYRMALRQRMHDKGVPVLVDYNEMPAAREAINLTDDLPVPEMKEAAAKVKRISAIVRTLVEKAKALPAKPLSADAPAEWVRKARGGALVPIIRTKTSAARRRLAG